MKKLVLIAALAGAVFSVSTQADTKPVDVKQTAPERYTVKKGDTLWDIANRYLQDPWRWPEIWQANQQIRNPHLIFPGDKLVLCRIEQRAVVAVDTGGGCDEVIANFNNRATATGDGSLKLSPQIRSEELSVAIPAIPLQAIRAYLSDNRVLEADDFKKAPYVLSGANKRVISGQGDTVYVRGKALELGQSVGVYRKGLRYDDPDTKEPLGYEAEDIASGNITAQNGDVFNLQLTRSTQEVRIEDRVFVNDERQITPIFYPSNPVNVKSGRIIRILSSLVNGGLNSVIVLNRGERDGVTQGHTFAIYQRGEVIRDRVKDELIRLPSERAGLAMVFRTFDKVSYAIVLKAAVPVTVGDEIRPPVSGD
ncbi:LysM peptidoglycan-binding domain-containing protein [Agitococcus lubricus]|uniref:LysM domain-containing protein n=1 Tax=Agitococcus lubricus TaxID=1077255 RepID=A0A2T5IY82_9GAMM|nr:LysM domain-containing protein [Agitococcus lubricus]PTQ88907.1 LysM domain-containing protein [Agitococcus lubricus]